MLLSLIAIKIVEFVKMVVEAIQAESYKAYFKELHEALKLEFAEIQIIHTLKLELYGVQEKFGFLQRGIKAEVTALAPIADKAVAVAKHLKDSISSTEVEQSAVLGKEQVAIN